MIVVDTSVWADWFNARDTPGAACLDEALQRESGGCLIAQSCIAAGAELLSADRDFVMIARYSALRPCAASLHPSSAN